MSSPTITLFDIANRLDRIEQAIDVPAKRFLSVESAAEYCDLSVKSVRRAIARGDLEPLRAVRGKILLDRLALDSWILSSANRRLVGGRGSWAATNAKSRLTG